MWHDLTIVTSCTNYHQYLPEWTASIIAQTVHPGRVCIFTHGTSADDVAGERAVAQLMRAQIPATHQHRLLPCHNLGAARNCAVEMTRSEWVLHLDADDTLKPQAIAMCQSLADDADVICAGYERTGRLGAGLRTRIRTYEDADGVLALDQPSMTSSNSPFRRRFWEKAPYRTDMFGAWDTALWISFAHLGARFRATPEPVFDYRQHADSVFNTRQRTMSWARVHTVAELRDMRRKRHGVAIIVPRDYNITIDRARNWAHVKEHYETHHPEWPIIVGMCPSESWCKGAAIQSALNYTNADIIVIADADCIVDPAALTASVDAVRQGAGWAMPHLMVRRLNELSTMMYLNKSRDTNLNDYALQVPLYEGASGGGIVVIKRGNYDAIGGFPQAFRGWGSEDRAFGVLADRLIAPCHRGTAELLHLFHVPQPRTRHAEHNLRMLQMLGYAAIRGKDDLIVTLSNLPKAGSTIPAVTQRNVFPIDLQAATERMANVAARRRRIP